MSKQKMREALESAMDFAESMRRIFADDGFTDRYDDAGRCERMRDYLREALSTPAPEARTEHEWIGSDEIRYKVSATFGVLSLSYFHEWKGRFEGIDIDDADNVRAELAAEIARLAGLVRPGDAS